MEVSYTDHSHIIGRGGNTISRVMEQTRCHVHFPDSNRTNQTEKSNLVTVAGELSGVEKARARVRVKKCKKKSKVQFLIVNSAGADASGCHV